MSKTTSTITETERLARVITKCYSKATLKTAAEELGAKVTPDVDIFRALIVAKIAPDFDEAVRMVVKHLDNSAHVPIDSGELVDGKVDRRARGRQRLG